MSTKTKFIFLMSFLTLVIVGCVASMVIVLAAPKQNGVLDVSIKYDAFAIRKEAEQFNGRDYYYIRMGEYPQTYAGAATSVTGLIETQEKFVCDMSETTGVFTCTVTENKEYNVWIDKIGGRYIKHTTTPYGISDTFLYANGKNPASGEIAYFRIDSIKWDIIGYYTDDSKETFIKASDESNFDPSHKNNLVVASRIALQAMSWYPTNSDINYYENENKYSTVYHWLRTFEDNILHEFKNTKIELVENYFTDSNGENTSWETIKNNSATMISSPVFEYAWIPDYNQASALFSNNKERLVGTSDFAIATYAYQNYTGSNNNITKENSCNQWLRSSYYSEDIFCAGIIDYYGALHNGYIYDTYTTVRPCMLVNL